ncbi:MAG: carboxypeptidase-like regulatory domain-containing protein [Bernardetiaceae bacterium]|nr:carboxypeptidase-like regulatory domain-containing protein [Bernardetiaceae bacterium]
MKQFLFLFMFLWFLACNIFNILQAQDFTLRGQVLDAETDKALPFTHVRLEGSETGVVADVNGYFDISLSEKDKQRFLIFSYIGYQTQRIQVNAYLSEKSEMVYLEPHEKNLDSILVEAKYSAVDLVREALDAVPENHYFEKAIRYKAALFIQATNEESEINTLSGGDFEVYRPPMRKQLYPNMRAKKTAYWINDKLDLPPFNQRDLDMALREGFDKHQNISLLNKKRLADYIYVIKGLRTYQDTTITYWIQAHSLNKEVLFANFYLDTASLAFVQIELFPHNQFFKYGSKTAPRYSFKQYKKDKGKWILDYYYAEGYANVMDNEHLVKQYFINREVTDYKARPFFPLHIISNEFSILNYRNSVQLYSEEEFYQFFPYFSVIQSSISNQ